MAKPTVSLNEQTLETLKKKLELSHCYIEDLLALARQFPSTNILLVPPVEIKGAKKKKVKKMKAQKAGAPAAEERADAASDEEMGEVPGYTCASDHDPDVCDPGKVPLERQYKVGEIVRDLKKALAAIEANETFVGKQLKKLRK